MRWQIFLRAHIAFTLLFAVTALRAEDYSPFTNAFERAVFCTVALATVGQPTGNLQEFGRKINDGLTLTDAEGKKRGLTVDQIREALDREAAKQDSMQSNGHTQELLDKYQYCRTK